MSRRRCPRAWQAEAVEDGRLAGVERLSFERHVPGCAVCADEVAAAARLREIVQHAPALTSTPLEQLRLRGALLTRANQALVGTSPRAPRWLIASASIAVLSLALVGGKYWRSGGAARHAPHAELERASAPRFEIVSLDGAHWLDRSAGAVARAVVSRGSIAVHVQHLTAGQRFLLALPDGEIEVYGTRFVVAILNHRTQRVEVTEGLVALRLQGQLELRLTSGGHWNRPPVSLGSPAATPAVVSEPSKTATIGSVRETPSLPASTTAVRSPSKHAPRKEVTHSGKPPRAADELTAQQLTPPDGGAEPRATPSGLSVRSQRFADAVAAFHAGAYEDAKRRLAEFARDFPQGPHSEDVAFVRVVACLRTGDDAQAVMLASEYLRRFPNGLRRHEADRILRDVSHH